MKNTYESPLASRYASDEMLYIFSPDKKFSTWRRLWIALARAEKELGLTQITDEMIAEMEAHIDDINYGWNDAPFYWLYAIGCVLAIYTICTIIDIIRIKTIETPLLIVTQRFCLRAWESIQNKITIKYQ